MRIEGVAAQDEISVAASAKSLRKKSMVGGERVWEERGTGKNGALWWEV